MNKSFKDGRGRPRTRTQRRTPGKPGARRILQEDWPQIITRIEPNDYEYIVTMANATGISRNEFVRRIVHQHAVEHAESAEKARETHKQVTKETEINKK